MFIPPRRLALGTAVVGVAAAASFAFATPWVRHRLALVLATVVAMLVADAAVVARWCGPARWYVLHALANLVVTVTALPDVAAALLHPTRCFSGPFSLVPALVVPATHLYHLLAFPCSTGEWVHHCLFAGVICPLGLFFDPGPVQNLVGFFICGLPGGLDYAMLALVKLRKMDVHTEKVWNARINVWLRSPGLLLAAFCCLVGRFDEHVPPEVTARVPWFVAAVSALLCVLNGQYYMQVVVGNTFVRTRERGSGAKAYNS